MGCTSSKLDDLPAVVLCRERCSFLEDAIKQRYALAESHVAYTHSLIGIGHSLHHFITHHHRLSGDTGDPPSLNLPPQRKGDLGDDDSPKNDELTSDNHQNHSGSGSVSGHIEFDSASDDEDDEDELDSLRHHSDHSTALHNNRAHHLGGDVLAPIGYMGPGFTPYPNPEMMMGHPSSGGFMHMNYMKSKATPSVVYEQRPLSPPRVYMGDSSSSSTSAYHPYPYRSSSSYSGYGPGPGPGPGVYEYSLPNGASLSKPPPPPPFPPSNSAWDFLNPFDSYDKHYPPYTPSRDSRELREEEGIPDLEDEDFQHEVAKEVHGDRRFVPPEPIAASDNDSDGEDSVENSEEGGSDASMYQTRQSVPVEKEGMGMEYEVHGVDKTVVEERSRGEERRSNGASAATGTGVGESGSGGGGPPRAVAEVAKEIEVQFVRAADSGSEIAKMLEAGKHSYRQKHGASKILQSFGPSVVLPSQSSTSIKSEASSSSSIGPTYLDIEEELASKSSNLSSILHKLHLWEKKLYREVKAEEKLRVVHDRKFRKLKRLQERGAEAHKIDATQTILHSLSTKLRVAIEVVDKISGTINKIRDEELWPQLHELIEGLIRMWKSMLECHQSQCQAINEARGLGPIKFGKKLGDDHLEATRMLGHELINWILGLSSWVNAQKSYVKALNSWLRKCLLEEPEETLDGIAPFSPSRIGAPQIFVICNHWAQALDKISEKEVTESIRSFTTSVLQLWEQDKLEMNVSADREEQKIQKEIQALERKMVLVAAADNNNDNFVLSGNIVYQNDAGNDSLRGCLKRIFEAIERFMIESLKVYEELLQRTEEDSVLHK